MKTWTRLALAPAAIAAVAAVLAGCSSVSDVTRDRVARSEATVRQAEQQLGNSETGALDLQRAKENLNNARRALDDKDEKAADRFANLAQLDAELALAKADSAHARKAADELMASIETLRRESARGTSESERVTPEQ